MPASCIEAYATSGIEIRDNVIHGCSYEMGIFLTDGSDALIEGNDIMVEDVLPPPEFWRSDGRIGILAEGDAVATIRDNDIHDSRSGFMAAAQDRPAPSRRPR